MDVPIRVLLIEDDEDDYRLTRELLADIQGNHFHLDWVQDYEAGLAALGRAEHDVYLLDYRLGQGTGLELLHEAAAQGAKAPIILLTGQGEHAVDVQAMQAGAADYLVKGQIDAALLQRSIRYALQSQRDRQALRQLHADLEKLVQKRTEALRAEISQRQRLQEELHQQTEVLKQADRRKDEFLAMLAHELRNPLAPISAAAQVMQPHVLAHPILERARDVIERQVQHLARLVDDLLDVSRITRGKIRLHRELIDMSAVIARAVETSRPVIDARRHELTISLPAQPLPVLADSTRLAQVLSNLLNNAAKYTEEGGHIRLTASQENEEIVVRVCDNGMGIPAEFLNQIFNLFTQAHCSLDRAQGGLGIGLTLVRALVEMHQGRVQAQSAGPGQGSEFVVCLPRARDTRLDPEAPKTQQRGPAIPSRRILLVDDNVDATEMLATLLQSMGHEVWIAHEGRAALQAARSHQPEIVFLDIGLPDMNGYEVSLRLRQQPAMENAVLVAFTGYGQEEDRLRSKRAGFDHHLVKPIKYRDLQELLDSLPTPATDRPLRPMSAD